VNQKIKELKIGFAPFPEKLSSKNEFDARPFQAWKDFTGYAQMLH
jgi:hypothetical protein